MNKMASRMVVTHKMVVHVLTLVENTIIIKTNAISADLKIDAPKQTQ
jgi:hypothetical protein